MTRRHDIDALRVFAFALLILYHTAMAYVDDWGFHLKSVHTAEGCSGRCCSSTAGGCRCCS